MMTGAGFAYRFAGRIALTSRNGKIRKMTSLGVDAVDGPYDRGAPGSG
jgi:hypothetical protein